MCVTQRTLRRLSPTRRCLPAARTTEKRRKAVLRPLLTGMSDSRDAAILQMAWLRRDGCRSSSLPVPSLMTELDPPRRPHPKLALTTRRRTDNVTGVEGLELCRRRRDSSTRQGTQTTWHHAMLSQRESCHCCNAVQCMLRLQAATWRALSKLWRELQSRPHLRDQDEDYDADGLKDPQVPHGGSLDVRVTPQLVECL